MTTATSERVLRILAIAIVLGCGAVGLLRSQDVLVGALAWLVFLLGALAGWGYIAARAMRIDDPDLGLRAIWGAALLLAVAGPPLALGVCSRPVLLGLLAIGAAGFGWRELVTSAPCWHGVRALLRAGRAEPTAALVVVVLGLMLALQVAGAVAQLDRNPWDDDVAYIPLVKRLLDRGDLIEPFSFRRMAAYGGQTVLGGIAAARGTVANVHLLDGGLGLVLAVLLLVGHAKQLGRVPRLWLALLALVVLFLPDISINTASHWTGVAFMLGLYRTLARGDAERRWFVAAALVGAATCTLRHNYIPVVVLLIGLSLWWRGADRRTWATTAGIGAVVLVAWCAAAYASNRTFLFPVFGGTWNRELSLQPSGMTWFDTATFVVSCCIETQPIVVIPILFVLVAATRDTRAGRPLMALFVASIVGFLLLARSFTGADAFSIWRYCFGFAIPLAMVFVLEVTNERDDNPVVLPALGRWVLLAAMLLQLFATRGGVARRHAALLEDLREAQAVGAHGDPNARAEARRYAALQATVPVGTPLAVMVDDPAFLDFARNPVVSFDTPGFSSPAPQLPVFCGPEAFARYLVARGFRHVAFVRPERSRYFYRREFWVWRLFNDSELFQTMSLYTIDAIDNLVALAAGPATVVYDADGLVMLDLLTVGPAAECPGREAERRDDALRRVTAEAGIPGAWSLSTRHDVLFLDGLSNVTFLDEKGEPTDKIAGLPVRWMYRRAHARVRGEGPRHLHLTGSVRVDLLHARPRIDVSLAGTLLGSAVADEQGRFTIDADVDAGVASWTDLYLVFSAIGTPEKEGKDLRMARLEELRWEPRAR